ncbi:MAG: hypothetical protein KIT82_14475 [Bradyrhizobium sp.]|nr:hypothetical protein [Bradyrhizobium sp.]
MVEKISRSTVAAMAGLKPAQFEYLRELDIVRPDVGDQRKGYSPLEARLAVIAGRAMACGMTPKAIAEPMKWLRGQVTWPAELPEGNLPEAVIEFEAERYRMFVDVRKDQTEQVVQVLARWIYDLSTEDGSMEMSESAHEHRKRVFAEAFCSDSPEKIDRARRAEARSRELLAIPQKWTYERFREIEQALEFELACQRKRDQFFHISSSPASWKARLSFKLEEVDTESAWIVIAIRRLFTDRIFLV